jgi:hypothetical protein
MNTSSLLYLKAAPQRVHRNFVLPGIPYLSQAMDGSGS